MRLIIARGRNHPDGSVVTIFLLVHRYAHKRDAVSIGRNLRITDPDKIEEIFFGDVALLRESIFAGE